MPRPTDVDRARALLEERDGELRENLRGDVVALALAFRRIRREARAVPASPEAPASGLAEIERLVDEFAAAQRGPAKMRPSLGTRRALLSAISRAVSEARREATEEALRVVAECADREGLLNDDEAIICGGEVFDRLRSLASTTRGDAR